MVDNLCSVDKKVNDNNAIISSPDYSDVPGFINKNNLLKRRKLELKRLIMVEIKNFEDNPSEWELRRFESEKGLITFEPEKQKRQSTVEASGDLLQTKKVNKRVESPRSRRCRKRDNRTYQGRQK